MNADQYQQLALRTLAAGLDARERLINAALGLSGEAGEFADTVKKTPLPRSPSRARRTVERGR